MNKEWWLDKFHDATFSHGEHIDTDLLLNVNNLLLFIAEAILWPTLSSWIIWQAFVTWLQQAFVTWLLGIRLFNHFTRAVGLFQKHLNKIWSNQLSVLQCWACMLFKCQGATKPKIRVKSCYYLARISGRLYRISWLKHLLSLDWILFPLINTVMSDFIFYSPHASVKRSVISDGLATWSKRQDFCHTRGICVILDY